MTPMDLTYDSIKGFYSFKGYPFAEQREVINLGGIRNKEKLLDQFNDIIFALYLDGFGRKECLLFPGTTKPGLHYLKQALGNPKGTFIVALGFHKNALKLGLHNGYDALVQSGPGVWSGHRDPNSDGVLDESGPIYTDSTNVDLHRTRADINVNNVVDRFSAGCQVLWEDSHLGMLLYLVKRTFEITKKSTIDYALFQEA